LLGKIAGEDAKSLHGKAGISAMKEVYSRFREVFATAEFGELKAKGGRLQRVLWASTGTKNPAYSATIYVDNLVAQDTVNTVPPATLAELLKNCSTALAFSDSPDFSELSRLEALGIDVRTVCSDLQVKGVDSFMKSFDEVLAVIERKLVTMRA
ncbi:MAG: transaldolase family protein, partial [Candidatus Brocadiia bacterium]